MKDLQHKAQKFEWDLEETSQGLQNVTKEVDRLNVQVEGLDSEVTRIVHPDDVWTFWEIWDMRINERLGYFNVASA